MAIDLTDAQIRSLIDAPKDLPGDYEEILGRITVSRKHQRSSLEVASPAGRFVVMLRQNTLNPFDFSAILGYRIPKSNRIFRLRRYNGKHQHDNKIERETIDGFHIHEATERYQARGGKEDTYATRTGRYGTLNEALSCLLQDCNFREPSTPQQKLDFGW